MTIVVVRPGVDVVSAAVGRTMAADVVTATGAVGMVPGRVVKEAMTMAAGGSRRN